MTSIVPWLLNLALLARFDVPFVRDIRNTRNLLQQRRKASGYINFNDLMTASYSQR